MQGRLRATPLEMSPYGARKGGALGGEGLGLGAWTCLPSCPLTVRQLNIDGISSPQNGLSAVIIEACWPMTLFAMQSSRAEERWIHQARPGLLTNPFTQQGLYGLGLTNPWPGVVPSPHRMLETSSSPGFTKTNSKNPGSEGVLRNKTKFHVHSTDKH